MKAIDLNRERTRLFTDELFTKTSLVSAVRAEGLRCRLFLLTVSQLSKAHRRRPRGSVSLR
jgi:hypothetical protein